jgi:predicted lipoprotein
MRIRSIATHLLAAGLLLALSQQGASAADDRAYNLRTADEHIIPGYRELARTTSAFDQQAATFCETPTHKNLEAVRESFHTTMDAWQSIQHIRFGPVELLLRSYRYQMWPDKRGTVAKHLRRVLASSDPVDLEPERFAKGSVAVQGLSAAERLLFGSDASSVDFGQDAPGRRRCAVLRAIAQNLSRMSAEIVAEWTQGPESHRTYLATAAQGNAYYQDDRELSARLLNNLHTQLQRIGDQKLGLPLGESLERARGRRAESWRSVRSLRNIRHNLQGVRELYRTGFGPRLADEALGRETEAAFARALRALEAVPKPLAQTVEDPTVRGRAETLHTEVSALAALFAGPLPQALDLPLGFNSLDGD